MHLVARYCDGMKLAGSIDLGETLVRLAKRRPVFHSEADFQLAFAWEVQRIDPLIEVYLETRPLQGVRLDIAFERPDLGQYTAVELKYLTRPWSGTIGGQQYDLKNGARDNGRYDVVKDIARVERFVESRAGANGAVIVLTNDSGYWEPKEGSTAIDSAFRINEGAVLVGKREWGRAPAGAERRNALELRYRYEMHWTNFVPVSDETGVCLRQLVVEVPGPEYR